MTAPPFLSRHELSVERKSYHRSCWTELTCQGTLLPDSGSKFMKETPSGTGRYVEERVVRRLGTGIYSQDVFLSLSLLSSLGISPRKCSEKTERQVLAAAMLIRERKRTAAAEKLM